jgi:hypothetical protein
MGPARNLASTRVAGPPNSTAYLERGYRIALLARYCHGRSQTTSNISTLRYTGRKQAAAGMLLDIYVTAQAHYALRRAALRCTSTIVIY